MAVKDWADLRRGVYQCVKYRAVMEAQEAQPEGSARAVRAVLVTESGLPADLDRIVKRLDFVTHLPIPPAGRRCDETRRT